MYRHKYHKYKYKYIQMQRQLEGKLHARDDPNIRDGEDMDNPPIMSDDELERMNEVYDRTDEKITERINKFILNKKDAEFEGYDMDIPTSTTNDLILDNNLQQKIVDIGITGKARGKLYEIYEFDKSDFTGMKKNKSNKNKILTLKDKDAFDLFTDKYGKIRKVDGEKKVFINWDKVATDFKGIYIISSSLGDRNVAVTYNNEVVPNWLDYDFGYLDQVVIFKKSRDLINHKEITKPFKGYMVDENVINDSDFVKITDENKSKDDILFIGDVKSFDKFTNRYGFLKRINGEISVKIEWDKVESDYDGFYIDKDNNFEKDRIETAFYKGNQYPSWLDIEDIETGVVYLFA